MKTFYAWVYAITIAALLALSGNLDGPSDIEDARNQSANLSDAQRAARKDQATARACGINAGYVQTAQGAACTTHKGKRTGQVIQLADAR